MAQLIKIAITGNDFDKKLKAVQYISDSLQKKGVRTILVCDGKDCCCQSTEKCFQAEEKAKYQARDLPDENAVMLTPCGLLDVIAKQKREQPEDIFENADYIRNTYGAVFHLLSDSKFDDKILSLWTGTPHLRTIKGADNFEQQLSELEKEVKAFLGIPERLEIERKLLIEYPSLETLGKMHTCRRVPITQVYLNSGKEGKFRVRKRGDDASAVYIKTVKKKISDVKRIEIENEITRDEYEKYISQKENIIGTISKDRYCIVYDATYYELDVYPFWKDRATLEVELLSEDKSFSLPPFVRLIRDVSAEKKYRNFYLAQKYCK